MAEQNVGWFWWAGPNEEWLTLGPFDSRQEAIDTAISDGIGEWFEGEQEPPVYMQSFYLVEARQDPIRLSHWIEADEILCRAEEVLCDSDRVSDEYEQGPYFTATQEQQQDLIARIKATCDEWEAAHGLSFRSNMFSHSRIGEYFTVSRPEDAKP